MWYNSFMKDELQIQYAKDWSTFLGYPMQKFYMTHITVDGILTRKAKSYGTMLFSFKEDFYDDAIDGDPYIDGGYHYHHDGYPIDEEFWLKHGEVMSTAPMPAER